MNTPKTNTISETRYRTLLRKAKQILAATRPRATWANATAIDYLDAAEQARQEGKRPYSVGTYSGWECAQDFRIKYEWSLLRSLEILESAGLVERVPSRGGATAFRWKGE